jgi:hypothetical protein
VPKYGRTILNEHQIEQFKKGINTMAVYGVVRYENGPQTGQ